MKIQIRYFAELKEQVGADQVLHRCEPPLTAA